MEAGGSVRKHAARQVPNGACWGLHGRLHQFAERDKNGQERQARGVMDSDAFILPDYDVRSRESKRNDQRLTRSHQFELIETR